MPPFCQENRRKLKEWLYTVEKAIQIWKPRNPVCFAGTFFERHALRWPIYLSDEGKMTKKWWQLKTLRWEAFSSSHEAERNGFLLVRERQSADLESHITTFTGQCLLCKQVDELTMVTLYYLSSRRRSQTRNSEATFRKLAGSRQGSERLSLGLTMVRIGWKRNLAIVDFVTNRSGMENLDLENHV